MSHHRVSENVKQETKTFFSFLLILFPLFFSPLLSSQDYQHGIFQSIGFKEFHDYLTVPESSAQREKDALRDKGQTETYRDVFRFTSWRTESPSSLTTSVLNLVQV